MKRLLVSLIIIITLTGGFTYVQLGGLKEVEISLKKGINTKLQGFLIPIDASPKEIKERFMTCKSWITEKESLNVIYKNSSEEKPFFIGVKSNKYINSPDSCDLVVLKYQKVISAHILSHELVRPSAISILKKIKNFAQTKNILLEPSNIEIYRSSYDLEVWVPCKEVRSKSREF